MNKEKWYARSSEEVVDFWRTDLNDGLSSNEVRKRLNKFGYNELREEPKKPWWKNFLAQFQDFMVCVLIGAAIIALLLGEYIDAVTILAIVFLNAILGFVQEYRAEKSLEALKKIAAPLTRVVRNGMVQQVNARDVVPGDVLVLEAGDRLSSDARLVESYNLETEESALTGESLPVRKTADTKYREETLLAERKNMVFAGTSVNRGRGKAVVCSCGMNTEVGHIAGMIQSVRKEETPLEKRLAYLGKYLVFFCILICAVVVVTGILKGESLIFMCMTGISLAVAAIPEGLPAIVTVALALGVQRMIKRRAIVRKLPAVETLGCTTVICSDKTGTLTKNSMTIRKIYSNDSLIDVTGLGYDIKGSFILNDKETDITRNKTLIRCLSIGALCNNTVLKRNNVVITGMWRDKKETSFNIEGDPTEGAMVVAAAKAGIWKTDLEKTEKRIAEIPFESERRRMSTVYKGLNNEYTLYTKGAPDTILTLCKYYQTNKGQMLLTAKEVEKIGEVIESMSSDALRVLALAYRKLTKNQAENVTEDHEEELVFVGLVGMIDPPREGVKKAIATCHRAGIKAVMITGDHKNTAVAIAKELEIYKEDKHKAVTGADIDKLDDKELDKVVNDITVYSRVSPLHKLRIVKSLKRRGHIVAMTGDGVNDAPAIKEADIGIAMGKSGTEVTKEASDMTLADDNFATIVEAIEEGRGIYNNIRKFIRYLLSCNIGEVFTMFFAALCGMAIPLLPLQILWVNLVTDGLPAMALGVDKKDSDIMERASRYKNESVFSRGLSRKILFKGIQIAFCTLLVFNVVLYLRDDLAVARTAAFATLVFSQMFNVFECRSETKSVFEIKFSSNMYLVGAVICSIMMQLAVMYLPFFNSVFYTVPLSAEDFGFVILVSGFTVFINMFRYMFKKKTTTKVPVPSSVDS